MHHPHSAFSHEEEYAGPVLGSVSTRGDAAARSTPPNDPVRTVTRLGDLDAAFDPDIEAVILQRKLPSFATSTLNVVASQPEAKFRLSTSIREIDDGVDGLLHNLGFAYGPARDWMAEDVADLSKQFMRVLSIESIALRGEVVRDDACRKFHRDAVQARMICTYKGPGTLYGVATSSKEPGRIEIAPTGCPIFLKGKAWPGGSQGVVAHRSPPIEGTGESRLVIVINEAPRAR